MSVRDPRPGDLPTGYDAMQLLEEMSATALGTPSLRTSAALGELAGRLSAPGLLEEAVVAREAAVRHLRVLAEADPAARPALARSLVALSAELGRLGTRRIGAVADRYRHLARLRPALFQPALARALSELSFHFVQTDAGEEAHDAAEEAVDVLRALAREEPAEYVPPLADMLLALSSHRKDAGQDSGALRAARQAVLLQARRARTGSLPSMHGLARALEALSRRLAACGRPRMAQVSARAARQAADAYEAAVRSRCGSDVCFTGSEAWWHYGRHHDCRTAALAAADEAVALWREVATGPQDGSGGGVTSDLADALDRRRDCWLALCNPDRAADDEREAASLRAIVGPSGRVP